MNDTPGDSQARTGSHTPGRSSSDSDGSKSEGSSKDLGTKKPAATALSPSDPTRQAKRIPIRILKMLTAHSHLLHPDYLQPLTSAPVSIELDAKKSPLALLAQTCSQIGKPDPPPASKLGSMSSGSLADKESGSQGSGSGLKLGSEPLQPLEDKSSFKPYSKLGGECRKDGSGGGTDKAGFRVPGGGGGGSGSAAACSGYPPHVAAPTASPNSRTGSGSGSGSSSGSSPQHAQLQPHRQASQSPCLSLQPPLPHSLHGNPKPAGGDVANADAANGGVKKEPEPGKPALDGAQLANSSHARASANSSNASSDGSPHHDSGKDSTPPQPPGALGSGHVAPVSPFKPGHSVFPLPPSSMGYHGSIVGAYAGYPSQFVPGLDHTKSALVGGGIGVAGKHASSSPLTGASPPSFMQGLCRDPYCLTYPNAPHLGGGNCTSCVHDPSSPALKSGFPLVYPGHPLHSLHPSSLSSSVTPALSHPLYTYGFMLPSEPPHPHACNWVSAGGPCDKRFSSSEELLAHLRTHTALSGLDNSKLLSAYPSSISSSAAASCHLHLPPPSSPNSPFSLRTPHSLGLARYHPYGKAHLPTASPSLAPMHSLPTSAPYYSPYALYSQRLGSASALGYQ